MSDVCSFTFIPGMQGSSRLHSINWFAFTNHSIMHVLLHLQDSMACVM